MVPRADKSRGAQLTILNVLGNNLFAFLQGVGSVLLPCQQVAIYLRNRGKYKIHFYNNVKMAWVVC